MLDENVLICGPMYSGKSERLIEIVKKARAEGLECLIYKPKKDQRDLGVLKSRKYPDAPIKATPVANAHDIFDDVIQREFKPDIVVIDEIMLFDSAIFGIVDALRLEGIALYAAGLDLDFRGIPFKLGDPNLSLTMEDLKAQFDRVEVLTAYCCTCGKKANRTQRIVDGKPAGQNDPLILIGSEDYQARCQKHHEIEKGAA